MSAGVIRMKDLTDLVRLTENPVLRAFGKEAAATRHPFNRPRHKAHEAELAASARSVTCDQHIVLEWTHHAGALTQQTEKLA